MVNEVRAFGSTGYDYWQERVLHEKSNLDQQRLELQRFMTTREFNHELDNYQRELLRSQARVMAEYSVILGQRIESFFEPPR